MKYVTSKIKLIENLKQENTNLNVELKTVNDRLGDFERTRMENLEIVGVSETANENLYKVIEDIGVGINYHVSQNAISVAHRVQNFNN